MGENTPIVEARDVGRRGSDGGWLLRDVSLHVRPGERLGVAGPSGAGKTLLLRCLALLDPLDAGAVLWQGQVVRPDQVPHFRRDVIYLHQRPPLFEGTVEDNLRRPFSLRANRGRAFDRGRVLELLAGLGRDASFLGKEHRDLSGGEGQIVALLRALQLGPSVLLLDEATSALDPAAVRAAEELLERWLAGSPSTRALVWVSHDPAQAERVARRVMRLCAGRPEGREGQ